MNKNAHLLNIIENCDLCNATLENVEAAKEKLHEEEIAAQQGYKRRFSALKVEQNRLENKLSFWQNNQCEHSIGLSFGKYNSSIEVDSKRAHESFCVCALCGTRFRQDLSELEPDRMMLDLSNVFPTYFDSLETRCIENIRELIKANLLLNPDMTMSELMVILTDYIGSLKGPKRKRVDTREN